MTHTNQLAGIPARFFAFCIDTLIVTVVVSAFLFVSMGKTPLVSDPSGDTAKPSLMDKYQFFAYFEPILFDHSGMVRYHATNSLLHKYSLPLFIGIILMPLVYFAGSEKYMKGATIGKKICGIKVVKDDATPLSLMTAMIRFLVKFISALLFFIGFLFALFTKDRKAVQDMAAHTLVIKK